MHEQTKPTALVIEAFINIASNTYLSAIKIKPFLNRGDIIITNMSKFSSLPNKANMSIF